MAILCLLPVRPIVTFPDIYGGNLDAPQQVRRPDRGTLNMQQTKLHVRTSSFGCVLALIRYPEYGTYLVLSILVRSSCISTTEYIWAPTATTQQTLSVWVVIRTWFQRDNNNAFVSVGDATRLMEMRTQRVTVTLTRLGYDTKCVEQGSKGVQDTFEVSQNRTVWGRRQGNISEEGLSNL